MQVTIAAITPSTPWRYGSTDVTLRVFYSEDFIDGLDIPQQGGDGETGFYYEVACTVSSNLVTVPAHTIVSTTDSRKPTVTCSAFFYHKGSRKDALWTDWVIPNTPSVTVADLQAINEGNRTLVNAPDSYLTREATIDLLNALRAAGFLDITKPPYSADNTGVTDASSALQDALNAGVKKIVFPPGTYMFDPAARSHAGGFNMVTATGDGVEIWGVGATLTLPSACTLTANISFIAFTEGYGQSIHGFKFNGASTITGNFSCGAIAVSNGAYGAHVYDNVFTAFHGFSSGGSSGANIISTYNGGDVYPYPAVQATLGTAIAAGTRTVTPSSMTGIYLGRYLLIDSIDTPANEERVYVTDVTKTTFTAVFANAHNSTADVSWRAGYWQAAVIENNFFYDNHGATVMVINSRGNRILNNTSVKSGITGNQHGLYVQGGDNYIAGNWLEGVYGYAIHQFFSDAAQDASGNVYDGNWVVDPGNQHVLVNFTPNVTNPLFPVGTSMTRWVTFKGNHFIRRSGNVATTAVTGVVINVPAVVEGNFFEDTTSANTYVASPQSGIGNEWLRVGPHSIVDNNYFYSFASLTTNVASSFVLGTYSGGNSDGVVVTNNSFYRCRASVAISLPGLNCVASNNTFDTVTGDANAATFPMIQTGNYAVVSGNSAKGANQPLNDVLASLVALTGYNAYSNTTDNSNNVRDIVRGLHVGEGGTLSVSSNAVAPTSTIHRINDAGGLIKTITLPSNGFTVGEVTLVAGSTPYTTDATGNIGRTITPAAGQAVTFSYSAAATKWYPNV